MGIIGNANAGGKVSPVEARLLLAQAFVAAAMTGVIWQVQLLTYPQFLRVGLAEFPAYHAAHTTGISVLVAPLMLAELGLALAALWQSRTGPLRIPMRLGVALVLGLWATTWLWQVPLHGRLEQGASESVIRELIAGNWLRTLLWSARSALLFWLLWRVNGPTQSSGWESSAPKEGAVREQRKLRTRSDSSKGRF